MRMICRVLRTMGHARGKTKEEEASGKTESRVMKLCKYANPHFLWQEMMLFGGQEEPEMMMGDLSPLPTHLMVHAFFPQKCSYVICVQSSPNLPHLTIRRYQTIMSKQHQRRGLLINRKMLETETLQTCIEMGAAFSDIERKALSLRLILRVVHRFLFVARH